MELYNGLPLVNIGEKVIILSPYAKKIAEIKQTFLENNNPEIKNHLEKEGFFGQPTKEIRRNKISFVVTTDCNLRCIYCYARGGENSKYMSGKYAINIIKEELEKIDDKDIYIIFIGGEPTLNMPVIRDIVNFTKNINGREIFYYISTNGAMDNNTLDFLIDNNFFFVVALDGLPDVQNSQRPFAGGGLTSSIVANTIKEIIKRKGNIRTRAVITSINVKYMKDSIRYFSELGIKYVQFEEVGLAGRALDNKKLLPESKEFVDNFIMALDAAKEYGISIINTAYKNLLLPTTHFCTTVAGDKFIFTPDGAVTSCYEIQRLNCNTPQLGKFIIGTYDLERDKLVLDSKKIDVMKNVNVVQMQDCSSCFIKYICAGGCPMRNIRASGNLLVPSKRHCEVRRRTVYEIIKRLYTNSKKGVSNSDSEINIFPIKVPDEIGIKEKGYEILEKIEC